MQLGKNAVSILLIKLMPKFNSCVKIFIYKIVYFTLRYIGYWISIYYQSGIFPQLEKC